MVNVHKKCLIFVTFCIAMFDSQRVYITVSISFWTLQRFASRLPVAGLSGSLSRMVFLSAPAIWSRFSRQLELAMA
jgi:hypothetical protein